jgi:head-tail adaptor
VAIAGKIFVADITCTLDTRITVLVPVIAVNAFNEPVETMAIFSEVWANRADVSTSESLRAQEVGAELTARFTVRWSAVMASVDPRFRIRHKDTEFNITGTRAVGRCSWIEIDAVAREGDLVTSTTFPGSAILCGDGAPSASTGVDGQFYLDIEAHDFYGPKTGGAWGAGTSLVGAPGADGLTVLNGAGAPGAELGADGDFYIDTADHAIYGPKADGAWGASTSLVGPAGVASSLLSRTAGVPIGGFKVVRDAGDGETAVLVSFDAVDSSTLILGVTTHAASEGADLQIMRQGEISDSSLELVPGPLFLGSNGAVVSTPPASGALVLIGTAVSSGVAIIDVQPPIVRG